MRDTFLIRFLGGTLVVSVLMLLILLIKRGTKQHISIRWQYNIDLLLMLLLVIPFLPADLLRLANPGTGWLSAFLGNQPTSTTMNAVSGSMGATAGGANWLQDFTQSVDRSTTGFLLPFLLGVWIAGALAYAVFTWYCNRELRLMVESTKPIREGELFALFVCCKAELGIRRRILFDTSILAKSPMTIGFFQNRIILPAGIEKTLPSEEIRYILLHELTHCKHRDVAINHLMCLLRILYWFNPMVFFVAKEMRLDRELACDRSVLDNLPEEQHTAYGSTLLHFINTLSRTAALSLATELGGSGRQIKKRVESIAAFVKESWQLRVKSIGIFALAGLLAFSQLPTVAALAAYDKDAYRFENRNVVNEDLSAYFEGYEGSFVLYDLVSEQYHIYNEEGSVIRVSPASTYKLYSALIAMDRGIIDSENSVLPWDGTAYLYDAWNTDQSLVSAMENSVNWYFQELDMQVGKKELASYYEQLSYGNHDLSGDISDYWLESSLRISPVEQVELLKTIFLNDSIFRPEHVDALKKMIRLSEKEGAVLSGKTGTSAVNGKVVNGWFIGYVERDQNTFIFATNIQSVDDAGGSMAAQITLSVLDDMGIY